MSASCLNHVLIHYFWMLYLVAISVTILLQSVYNYPPIVESRNGTFNSSEDPTIFTHFTDIHLNSQDKEHVEKFNKCLNQSIEFGSKFIIFTGDLADNYDLGFMKYGEQILDNFLEYNKSISIFDDTFKVFDIPGNHDEYGVSGYNESDHNFLDFSIGFNRSISLKSYWTGSVVIGDYEFVYINPFRYPNPHAKLGLWINPSEDLLDEIERTFQKERQKSKRVLLTHFPIRMWNLHCLSSSGKNIRDLIAEYEFDIVLTGHLHPETPIPHHHGKVLEMVGSDFLEHYRYAFVSNDNGNIAYHTVECFNPPSGIITNPVPLSQISSSSTFNRDDPLRVITFDRTPGKIKVNGTFEGEMIPVREVEYGYLYELPTIDLPPHGSLFFTGAFNGSINYVRAQKTNLLRELVYAMPSAMTTVMILFVIVFVLCFFFTLPLPSDAVDSLSLFKEENATFFRSILLGPLYIKCNILSVSSEVRIYLFVWTLLPLFMPLYIIFSGQRAGAIFSYGYIYGTDVRYDNFCIVFALLFYLFLLISIVVISSAYITTKFRSYLILDIIAYIIGICVCAFQTLSFGSEAVGPVLTFVSPYFIVFPAISTIIIINLYLSGSDREKKKPYSLMNGDN